MYICMVYRQNILLGCIHEHVHIKIPLSALMNMYMHTGGGYTCSVHLCLKIRFLSMTNKVALATCSLMPVQLNAHVYHAHSIHVHEIVM